MKKVINRYHAATPQVITGDVARSPMSTPRRQIFAQTGKLRRLPLLLLGTALIAGCASYRFASPVPERYRDLAIPVLASAVTQAEVEAVLTQALRREALRGGEFNVVGEQGAALVMRGKVTEYDARPVRYLRKTSGIPAEYRITMSARVSLEEAGTGVVVVPEFNCTAEATAVVREDLPTAKAATLNQVALRLARTILLEATSRFGE